jgi:hypothetical protein
MNPKTDTRDQTPEAGLFRVRFIEQNHARFTLAISPYLSLETIGLAADQEQDYFKNFSNLSLLIRELNIRKKARPSLSRAIIGDQPMRRVRDHHRG